MNMSDVRDEYAALRDRALATSPEQADYINGLWLSWDRTLADYPQDRDFGAEPYVDFLTRTIKDPRVHDDAVLDWLDAYPSAIHDRMPGGIFNPVSGSGS